MVTVTELVTWKNALKQMEIVFLLSIINKEKMKKTVKILALVLLVVTTMVSCTKNNGNKNANLIVGKWKCVSYNVNYTDYFDSDYFKWTKVGDFWNFSKDGTLNFVAYGATKMPDPYLLYPEGKSESNLVEIPISTHYIISDKWLTFFCLQCSSYFGGDSYTFEIIEISKDKLIIELDFSAH